jgi:hypothetical protein
MPFALARDEQARKAGLNCFFRLNFQTIFDVTILFYIYYKFEHVLLPATAGLVLCATVQRPSFGLGLAPNTSGTCAAGALERGRKDYL